jgi:hypothetical protein
MRIAKIMVLAFIVALWADVRPASCEGWSLLNPFGASGKTKTTKKFGYKTQPEPSLWQKTTSGTKNVFNKTGETLGLKKPTVQRPTQAFARPPALTPQKKESQSWLGKMFQPEPKKPKTVGDWMKSTKQIVPSGDDG